MNKKYSVKWLTVTAMLMAMNIVLSMEMLSIPVPGGHLYINDIVICTASILLDPIGAFIVGGVGAFLGDAIFYPAPMFVSLVTHGLQAAVISLIVSKYTKRPMTAAAVAITIGAVIMVAGYTVGRAYVYSTPEYAVLKLPFQCLQAALGYLAIPLTYLTGVKKAFDKMMN